MSIYNEVLGISNEIIFSSSLIKSEKTEAWLANTIERFKPKTVLEIGTRNGLSAAVIARSPSVESIITIDIEFSKIAIDVWRSLHVIDSITYIRVKNNIEKKNIINHLSFDLAFIDGDHSDKGVLFDYNSVRKTAKHIVFDNANSVGVKRLIDELKKTKHNIIETKGILTTLERKA